VGHRVQHGVPGDVRGHHVGRELHTGLVERERLRQGAYQQRLAQPGNALDEDMSGGNQGDNDLLDRRLLADDRAADLLPQLPQQLRGARDRTDRPAGGATFSLHDLRPFPCSKLCRFECDPAPCGLEQCDRAADIPAALARLLERGGQLPRAQAGE
jgi:hypothetical protein